MVAQFLRSMHDYLRADATVDAEIDRSQMIKCAVICSLQMIQCKSLCLKKIKLNRIVVRMEKIDEFIDSISFSSFIEKKIERKGLQVMEHLH